jgi:hypothetical protein
MTLYKCGHTRDTIILDDNIISYLAYLDWAESVGINGTKELCWDCWNEKNCKVKEDKDLQIKMWKEKYENATKNFAEIINTFGDLREKLNKLAGEKDE